MNYSKQRDIILNTLKENVVHPNAEYLYERVHEVEPTISKGTLYRNLNQLTEKGIIKKIDGLEASAHFDHNTHEHYHFICENCRRIYDIDKDVVGVISDESMPKGFKITWQDIIFRGICPECSQLSNSKKEN